MDDILTIKELCAWLKIAVRTAYIWVHQEKIPFVKIGGAVRFKRSSIERWLARKEQKVNSVWE